MEAATLDDFMAFNDQLAALVQAGVPLDVGLGLSAKGMARSLEKINATVARRVGRGASLAEALEGDEQAVPTAYRCLVQIGLRSGNFDAALDGAHRLAVSVDDSRHAVQSAFRYPLLVCCLAYAGMIGFCLFFVPTLESMYRSLRIRPGSGLHILESLRDTLPYWIALPPIVLLVFLAWRFGNTSRRALSGDRAASVLAWVPGVSRVIFQQRCAVFSETLATLAEQGVSLEESLRLAAGVCGDASLRHGARALAAALQQGQVPSDDSPVAKRFPPFLRWALWHSEATTGRGRAFNMAASVYRESTERRAERVQIVAPIVTCVILGGAVTMMYGLALFVPVVELLRALAS